MPEDRLVLHVDMDAFFAACEEARHPEWKGQPLVVGAAPKRGEGRGVVVAANYPARALGVRSALPIRDAWARAPDAHYVKPDHAHYATISRRVFEALRAEFSLEQVSIDEAYLDGTGRTPWENAADLARRVHEIVEGASGGLTCSVGVGPNKLVAKIASDHRKPNGTTLVPPGDVQAFLDPLPARKVPGIGPKTTERLSDLGITTIEELRAVPEARLVESFGSHGRYMHEASLGRDRSSVHAGWEPSKSISEEHTFPRDTRDRRALLATLRRMMGTLERDLVADGYWYKTVAIKIRFRGFETHTKQASLAHHAGDTTAARRLVPHLLDAAWDAKKAVRLIGLRLGDLAHGLGQTTLQEFVHGARRRPGAPPAESL